MSLLSIVVIDWCKVDIRDEQDDDIDTNCLMLQKKRIEILNLSFLNPRMNIETTKILIKIIKRGRAGGKSFYNGKHYSTKLILI